MTLSTRGIRDRLNGAGRRKRAGGMAAKDLNLLELIPTFAKIIDDTLYGVIRCKRKVWLRRGTGYKAKS